VRLLLSGEAMQKKLIAGLVLLLVGIGLFLRFNKYFHCFAFWGDGAHWQGTSLYLYQI